MKIIIPANIDYSDLKLARNPITLDIEFDTKPLIEIAKTSGFDAELFNDENFISTLLISWYSAHKQMGGKIDIVQEQILSEIETEDKYGIEITISGGGVQ